MTTFRESVLNPSDEADDTRATPHGHDGPGLSGQVPIGTLSTGALIGDYVVEGVLGHGGAGVVYAARHRLGGKRVAIKAMREEAARYDSMRARFMLESRAIGSIRHPNIVEIIEIGELACGNPYYVMPLHAGEDLREFLLTNGRMSPSELLTIFDPLCEAVQAAHEAGLIHRDIKASNVFIVSGEVGPVIKLLDFGIAKSTTTQPGQGLTEPGVQLGTAHNMAPEQVRCGPVDARTDIYALGVLMYQLLTGRYPFEGGTPNEVALKHVQARAPRPSDLANVPAELDAIVLRCLEKRPDQRFPSATELLAALRTACGAAPSPTETSALATAIRTRISVQGDAGDDDAIWDDVGDVFDLVEQTLMEQGFVLAFRSADTLLGLRLVGAVETQAAEQDGQALASELETLIAEREDACPRLAVSVRLRIGEATQTAAADGSLLFEGPLMDLGAWGGDTRA